MVRVDGDVSGWVNIEKGHRQRCVLSSELLSLYTQLVTNELPQLDGIKICGRNVNNIRYATTWFFSRILNKAAATHGEIE